MKKPLKSKKINGRKKGNGYELKIAKQIAETIGIEHSALGIQRTPNSGALDCRADLKVHPSQRHKWPFFMELKNRQSWRLDNIMKSKWEPYEWFLDAKEKLKIDPSYDKESPVILLLKRNNLDAFVMMDKNFYDDISVVRIFSIKIFDNDRNIVLVPWEEFLDVCYIWFIDGETK